MILWLSSQEAQRIRWVIEENKELWKKLPIGWSNERWGVAEDNPQVSGFGNWADGTAILQV